MKKKFLMKATLAVLLLAALGSCKKEEAKSSSVSQLNSEVYNTGNPKKDAVGFRPDEYTLAYQMSLSILDSLSCSNDYDVKNLHSLGYFSGGYVFCVPSFNNVNAHLVIIPQNLILSAFVIHNLQAFSNGGVALLPLKVYDYEIYDACDNDLLLDGKVYPNIVDNFFVVSNVYTTNFAAYQFNLNNVFNNANINTYSYYGPNQGTIRLTMDEFLLGVAKGCYLNLH